MDPLPVQGDKRAQAARQPDAGGRWRDLPTRLGDYRAVERRYYRWIEREALDGMLTALAAEPDLEWLLLDSTIVRAHQHAAGCCSAPASRATWSRPTP
ncbi:hypothetical protein SKB0092_43070 (plasmid) [Roseomonas mucosa]